MGRKKRKGGKVKEQKLAVNLIPSEPFDSEHFSTMAYAYTYPLLPKEYPDAQAVQADLKRNSTFVMIAQAATNAPPSRGNAARHESTLIKSDEWIALNHACFYGLAKIIKADISKPKNPEELKELALLAHCLIAISCKVCISSKLVESLVFWSSLINDVIESLLRFVDLEHATPTVISLLFEHVTPTVISLLFEHATFVLKTQFTIRHINKKTADVIPQDALFANALDKYLNTVSSLKSLLELGDIKPEQYLEFYFWKASYHAIKNEVLQFEFFIANFFKILSKGTGQKIIADTIYLLIESILTLSARGSYDLAVNFSRQLQHELPFIKIDADGSDGITFLEVKGLVKKRLAEVEAKTFENRLEATRSLLNVDLTSRSDIAEIKEEVGGKRYLKFNLKTFLLNHQVEIAFNLALTILKEVLYKYNLQYSCSFLDGVSFNVKEVRYEVFKTWLDKFTALIKDSDYIQAVVDSQSKAEAKAKAEEEAKAEAKAKAKAEAKAEVELFGSSEHAGPGTSNVKLPAVTPESAEGRVQKYGQKAMLRSMLFPPEKQKPLVIDFGNGYKYDDATPQSNSIWLHSTDTGNICLAIDANFANTLLSEQLEKLRNQCTNGRFVGGKPGEKGLIRLRVRSFINRWIKAKDPGIDERFWAEETSCVKVDGQTYNLYVFKALTNHKDTSPKLTQKSNR